MAANESPTPSPTSTDAFLLFAEDALGVLRARLARRDKPRQRIRSQTVFAGGSVRSTTFVKVDFAWLLFDEFDALLELDSARACTSSHLNAGLLEPQQMEDNNGNPVDAPEDVVHHMALTTVLKPLLDTLRAAKKAEVTRDEILADYERYAEAWRAKIITTRVVVPLRNVVGDFPATAIGANLQLEPFQEKAKNDMWEEWALDTFALADWVNPRALGSSQARLLGTFSRPRGTALSSDTIDSGIASVLTALRLSNEGEVGVFVKMMRHFPSGDMNMNEAATLDQFRVEEHGLRYSLSGVDLVAVISLAEVLNSVLSGRSHRGLALALRRFNQSYGRRNDEDKLLDHVIALESCLLHAIKTPVELKYRFTLRGTALLATCTSRKPEATKKLLAEAYDARSSIVHTGRTLRELGRKREFVRRTEALVRDTLLTYVKRAEGGKGLVAVNKELDDLIVERLGKGP